MKEIGVVSMVLYGKVDVIILIGGIVYLKVFVELIINYVKWIVDVIVYFGENEF